MDDSRTPDTDLDHWADWPLCPQCNHRRQAICDSCQFPGNDFPLADYLESIEISPIGRFEQGDQGAAEYHEEQPRETAPRVLLMCPQCDEAFPPHFYRTCQWCGHEFESGRQLENPLADQLTPQAMWTLFALALLGVGALWWFLWVTSR
jgi:hypothetical protein